jgi:hypothetical protein
MQALLKADGSGFLFVNTPRSPMTWEVCSPSLSSCTPFGSGGELSTAGANPETVFRVTGLDAADQPGIYLGPPPTRGFYRFDIQFTDRNGVLLGFYGAYLKLARPFWKVRLGLNRRRFHPGERVLSRIENVGTETVVSDHAKLSLRDHRKM